MHRLRLVPLREALEDVTEQNYREFNADEDDGSCSGCEHYEADTGYCDVLEMGVAGEWTCDSYDAATQEEADRQVADLFAERERSFSDTERALSDELNKGRADKDRVWPNQVFDDHFIYMDGGKYFDRSYALTDGNVTLGEPKEVEQNWTPVSEHKTGEEHVHPKKAPADRRKSAIKAARTRRMRHYESFAGFLAKRRHRALVEHNVVPHGAGHGGRGGKGAVAAGPRGGESAAGVKEDRAALKKGERFAAGPGGEAGAKRAMSALQQGDRVRVGIRQRGLGGESYRPHNVTGTVVQVRRGGTMQLRARDGDHVVKASDLASMTLSPPKAPRAAGRAGPPALYDSARPTPLGTPLQESVERHGSVLLDEAATASLRKDGTFPVKIIDPGWGSSGHYSHAVLKRAAEAGRFPTGVKMYWDHPTRTEANERPERSLRDLAAVTVSVGKYRDDGPEGPGVYAEARAFEQYRPYIEELAPHIGLSMRGYGNTKMGEADGKKGALVEDIVAVQSVDFVTQPGRGGKILQLFEAARSGAPIQPNPVEESDMDPEQIQALEEANRELMESQARLQEQLAVRDARDMVRDALESSGLPPITRKRLVESLPQGELPFVETNDALDRVAYATKIEEAIKSEKEYIESLGGPKVEGLGESGTPAELSEEDAQKQLGEALTSLIGDPEKAKHAIAGRVN